MAIYITVLLAILNQIGLKGSRMLVALYAIDFGAGPATIGFLVSMYAWFPLLLAVYSGRISDRIGVRRPMIAASFGMTAGLVLPMIWPSIPALFLSATLIGVANIFFHVPVHNLVGALGEGTARTNNFSTFSLGSAISGMLGPLMAGFIVDSAGYRSTYLWLALIAIVPAFILLVYGGFIPATVKATKEEQSRGMKELLGSPALRGTFITSGVIITGIDLFNFYMPIHGRSVGLSASMIGVILGMQAAAAFVIRLWLPWMSDRFGQMRVLADSLVMAGITYFVFPFFHDALLLATISFLLGLGLGCGQPLSIILTYNHAPPGRAGEALGLRITVNKATQIAVPVVFGSIGTMFGIYPIFWANGVLLMLGGYLTRRGERKMEEQAESVLPQ
jgi:MFS family permease